MLILVTGASGFLGKYVVAEALRRGYRVRAVMRPSADPTRFSWYNHPALELVRVDLRQAKGIAKALQGVDGVIHLVASVRTGDFYERFAGTVIATENLLQGMVDAKVSRLVFISTFSVYDYLNLRLGEHLDEQSPIEKNSRDRDEYTQTKLIQEELVRAFEKEHLAKASILRPGMIYGREDLWHALLGLQIGNTWLAIAPHAYMPMVYVENCAQAIVMAMGTESAFGQTINLVDDIIPKRSEFFRQLVRRVPVKPRVIPVYWYVMRAIAGLAWFVNRYFCGKKAKMPGIIVPAKLEARFKPLCYTNQRAKEILNWRSQYSLEQAIDRSNSDLDLIKVNLSTSSLAE